MKRPRLAVLLVLLAVPVGAIWWAVHSSDDRPSPAAVTPAVDVPPVDGDLPGDRGEDSGPATPASRTPAPVFPDLSSDGQAELAAEFDRLGCIGPLVDQEMRADGMRWVGREGAWNRFTELEQSTDPDHLYTAMHLASADPERFWELFDRMDTLMRPDDATVFLGALQCAKAGAAGCPEGYFDALLDQEQSNGMLWLLAASHALEEQEFGRAADYMDVAASLGTFDDHAAHSMGAIYESLSVATSRNHIERVIAASNVSMSAARSGLKQIEVACTALPPEDPVWADRCESLGRNLLTQDQSFVLQMTGTGIVTALVNGSEGSRRGSLEGLLETAIGRQSDLGDRLGRTVQLIMVDESLFDRFLSLHEQLGAMEAFERYIEEAEKRLADPDYRPCDGLTQSLPN